MKDVTALMSSFALQLFVTSNITLMSLLKCHSTFHCSNEIWRMRRMSSGFIVNNEMFTDYLKTLLVLNSEFHGLWSYELERESTGVSVS